MGVQVFLLIAMRLTAADHALAQTQQALISSSLDAADAHYREHRQRKLPGASADLWFSRSLFAIAESANAPLLRIQPLQGCP